MSTLSTLLLNAKRNLYLSLDPFPSPGTKVDEFTVMSAINQPYGIYGYTTALAALSTNGHLLITIKGTDDLSDVIKDIESATLETWPEVDPTGTAQFGDGFLDIFRDILVPWLATLPIKSAKSITVTGHSLGGALTYFTGVWLALKFKVKPVMYGYGAPIFGNLAAKQLMERLKLEVYDVAVENDPVPAISLPWLVRIGNGPKAPQRNFILKGAVEDPTLVIPPSSAMPWNFNPLNAGRHRLVTSYIPMLKNLLASRRGTVCAYDELSVRNDSLNMCVGANTQCVQNGGLIPCGAEGWCGSNGVCIAKHMPYNCSAATDCGVGAMCVTPGYHLPTTSWDSITEPCKLGATCSTNPWDLTKYCWNN